MTFDTKPFDLAEPQSEPPPPPPDGDPPAAPPPEIPTGDPPPPLAAAAPFLGLFDDADLESSFGASLEGTRFHQDAEAIEKTDDAGALAITEGSDVYLGSDLSDGGTEIPAAVIAHEIAHVVQHRSGEKIASDSVVEDEADEAATAVLRGEPAADALKHAAAPTPHAKPRKTASAESRFLDGLSPDSLSIQPQPIIMRPGTPASVVVTPRSRVAAPAGGAKLEWSFGFDDFATKTRKGSWPAMSTVGLPFVDEIRMPGSYWIELVVELGGDRKKLRRDVDVREPDLAGGRALSDEAVRHQMSALRGRLATERDEFRRPQLVEELHNLESVAYERGLLIRTERENERGVLTLPSGPGETIDFAYQKAPRAGGAEASRAFVESHLARSGLPFAAAKAELEEDLARAATADPSAETRAANARAKEQLALLQADQEAFRPQFRGAVSKAAKDLVDESETGIRQVLLRYGISVWPEELGIDPEILRNETAAQLAARDMIAKNTAPAKEPQPDQEGLASASRELLALQARLHALLQARVDLRLAMSDAMRPDVPAQERAELDRLPAPPGHDASYEPAGSTPEESLSEVQAEIRRLRRQYQTRWLELEQRHPVLAAYRDRGGSPTEALAGLTVAGDDQKIEILTQVLPKLGNLTRVRRELTAGKLSPLSLPPAIALAKQRLLVPPGSVRDSVADDEAEKGAKGDAHWAILALTFALVVATALPTGGSSAIAMLKVGAELGALALDAVLAAESVDSFQTQAAATNTDLDRARALSVDEPSLVWLVVDLLSIGIDVAQVRSAVREAGMLRRAAEAGSRMPRLVDGLNDLGRRHGLGDLGTRVEADAAPKVGASPAGKPGVRSPAEMAELRRSLPPELRMLPLEEAAGVAGSGVRVHYGEGELKLQVGPGATARHVGSHANAARRLLRYQGPLGTVRRLIDRILTFLKITPGYGTLGFEARHEVRKLNEILADLRGLQARLDGRVRSLKDGAASVESRELDRELADIQEQLEHHQSFVDSYQPGRGFIAAEGGRTSYAVSKAAAKPKVREGKNEILLTYTTGEGERAHDWAFCSIVLDESGVPMKPTFSIDGHFRANDVDYGVAIYDDVAPAVTAGLPPIGRGEKTPLTRFALDEMLAYYTKKFGERPAAIGGDLADQNKLNFQREFIRAKDSGLDDKAAKEFAVRNISFGRHRAAAGYDAFEVTFSPGTPWRPIDLGGDLGVRTVPVQIEVTATMTESAK